MVLRLPDILTLRVNTELSPSGLYGGPVGSWWAFFNIGMDHKRKEYGTNSSGSDQ